MRKTGASAKRGPSNRATTRRPPDHEASKRAPHRDSIPGEPIIVGIDTGVPIGFGLLTCETTEQALDRCGLSGSNEDKGREAAMAAVETALLLRKVRRGEAHEEADER